MFDRKNIENNESKIYKKRLENYIEKHLKRNIHPDKIKTALVKAGHGLDNVEQSFTRVHHSNNVKKIAAVIAVFLLVVLAVVNTNTEETSVEKPDKEYIALTPPRESPEPVSAEYEEKGEIGDIVKQRESMLLKQLAEQGLDLTLINNNPLHRTSILKALGSNNAKYCKEIFDENIQEGCEKLVSEKIKLA